MNIEFFCKPVLLTKLKLYKNKFQGLDCEKPIPYSNANNLLCYLNIDFKVFTIVIYTIYQ